MGKLSALTILIFVGLAAFAGYHYLSNPDGEEIFIRENCDKCHALRGKGLGVIDLTGITQKRGRVWVRDQIKKPRVHDPIVGMPSFAHLSDREIEALMDYIEGVEGE